MALPVLVVRSVGDLRIVLHNILFVPFLYAVFFNMLPTFLVSWDSATRLQTRFHDNFRYTRNNTYDFIVVGGGSSGAIIANRISEFYSVLLLECGGPPNPLHLVPALALSLLNHPQTDWRHKTTPQSNACLNSINQECLISGGRSLGGSSNLDYLAFLRGHPLDFDRWAMVTGDGSWNYSQLLPFFRRSEQFIGASTDSAARGTDGELRVREPDFLGLGKEWVAGGRELDYPTVDLNGKYEHGFSILQYPIRRGMRQSTDTAFLTPIRPSSRLRVLTHALVTKVLFRDMNNMAHGVEYERFGRTELAIASREVIISAGALGSPKLLLLSGIGPKEQLQKLGIPLRTDLPVGHNLQDHIGISLGPFYINSSKSFLQDRHFNSQNIVNWVVNGRGPLSTTGLQGVAAISSKGAKDKGEQPDILLLLQGQGIHRNYGQQFARAHRLQEDEMVNFYENAVGQNSFQIQVVVAKPVSTGEVRLKSANVKDRLIIDPHYLQDEKQVDIGILMEGIMFALRLVENSTAFQRIGARLEAKRLPGCESVGGDLDYWGCYIRRFSLSHSSPTSTVAMGAVLESNLKVRGTRGLRVIDASVMPSIVSVPTLATTLMIAEKGADFILREHGTPNLRGTIVDAVFGRKGLLARNPIQQLLSQEFDRLNPLPSLFRTNNNTNNPFVRFLPLLTGAGGSGIGGGWIQALFSTLNFQSSSLLASVLGGFGRSKINVAVSPSPQRNNFFDSIFPRTNQTLKNFPSPFPIPYIFGNRSRGTAPTRRPALFKALFNTPTIRPLNITGNNLFNNLFNNPFSILFGNLGKRLTPSPTTVPARPPNNTTLSISPISVYGPPLTTSQHIPQNTSHTTSSFSIPIVESTISPPPEVNPSHNQSEALDLQTINKTTPEEGLEMSTKTPQTEIILEAPVPMHEIDSLRAIRLVNAEAEKIRAIQDFHHILPIHRDYGSGTPTGQHQDLSTDFDYENAPSTTLRHYY